VWTAAALLYADGYCGVFEPPPLISKYRQAILGGFSVYRGGLGRMEIKISFILSLILSHAQPLIFTTPYFHFITSHHFITTTLLFSRPLVFNFRRWFSFSGDETWSTPCFQFQVMKFWYELRQISIIFLGFNYRFCILLNGS
jgi:hypothetical protein